MQLSELDQYWPNTTGPLAASSTVDGARVLREPQHIADNQPVGIGGGNLHLLQTQTNDAPRVRQIPLIWGGLGFVAGMMVWHMIGFWSFVSHVAFNDDARVAATAIGSRRNAVPMQIFKPKAPSSDLTQINSGNCVALAIDRASGDAKPGTCPVDEWPLADAGRTRRDDLAFSRPRLHDPQIWADLTAVESEVAAEQIDESAFDLAIRPGP